MMIDGGEATEVIKHRPIKPDKPASFYPILILTVKLESEYKQVEKILPRLQAEKQAQSYTDKLLDIQPWKLNRRFGAPLKICTGYLSKMGNAASALETYIYLDRVSPQFVFLCGIAGSLDPEKVQLGDVVVASAVDWWIVNKLSAVKFPKCYEIGGKFFRIYRDAPEVVVGDNHNKKQVKEFVAGNRILLPSNNDVQVIKFKKAQARERQNEIHFGGVVSWEYVLSDADMRGYILDRSIDGMAVEMEGGGFAYALRRRREEIENLGKGALPPFGFIFRGISDLSDKKEETHEEWRTVAMENTASAIVDFLNTFDDEKFLQEAGAAASS